MADDISALTRLVKEFYESKKHKDSFDVDDDLFQRVSLAEPVFNAAEATHAMTTILEGWISQGPRVRTFEASFAEYISVKHGVAVNSGSSANLVALECLRLVHSLQPGDEVIVPASTFATVAMPIIQIGLTPVYVDIARETLNISPTEIESAISDRTRVIMPVHTLGYPAEMNEIMSIAQRHHLLVLEDCCESHGSAIDGRKVGSYGDLATFSFFVAHNMTTGEGGMIVTSNEDYARMCRSLREFGRCDQEDIAESRYFNDGILEDYDKRYVFTQIGYNVRMTDICAAFGIEQLRKLPALNAQRQDHARYLRQHILSNWSDLFECPGSASDYEHTYYTFPILLREQAAFSRREFTEHLEQHGVETRPLFGGCLPDQPAFRSAPGRSHGKLPTSRYIRDRALFVGVHPGLTRQHMEHVINTITNFIKGI